jgi:hypothetical protein
MPEQLLVPYRATDFPPGLVNHSGYVTFTTDDLAHSLFATGRAPGDQLAYSMSSVWEWIHRTSLIPAYIRRSGNGLVTRSQLALDLDRSEKVGLSYSLGQAMTGIFCEQLLSAPFLLHIDRYGTQYGLSFSPTRKRADLFGPDRNGDWMVAEAKGRSNAMEGDLRDTLEAQKRSVSQIAGSVPKVAVGCVASFPAPGRTLRIDAFDPTEDSIESVQLDVNLDLYFLAYYEPFIAAIDFGEPDGVLDREDMIFSAIPPAGLRVGILRSIADRIRAARRDNVLAGLAESIWSLLAGNALELTAGTTFPDGTAIQTNLDAYLSLNDWESFT